MSFDPLAYARDELSPLLEALCLLAEEDGHDDQSAFFRSIRDGVARAEDAEGLADPFMQLSMSAFMGFSFASHTAMLLDQLLAKAQLLSETLSLEPEDRN